MDDHTTPSCPFCPFSDQDASFVEQHIEYCHPEGGGLPPSLSPSHLQYQDEHEPLYELNPNTSSPQSPDEDGGEKYIDCPHGCGETITAVELSTHLDLHLAEDIALDDSDSAHHVPAAEDLRSDSEDDTKHDIDVSLKGGKKSTSRAFARFHNSKPVPNRSRSPVNVQEPARPNGVKRLGRSELGPHAHEKKMPSWLTKMLEKGAKSSKQTRITADGRLSRHTTLENETERLVPVIAKLCEQDPSSSRVFLCSEKVRHICKMPREGGFCGYRNIQMLVSYIFKAKVEGWERFDGGGGGGSGSGVAGVPSILQLQDLIERAWDLGFNSSGRSETGGIKGTRKFIGTPEAQALFMSLGIRCDASSFSDAGNMRAYDALFMDVASYYRSNCDLDDEKKVFMTDLPPMYFQHHGHSMTIIGFEIRENGSANVLVFDPMFKTSPAVAKLIGTSARSGNPARLLKAYRRETKYLQKYDMFELLKLPIHPVSGPVSATEKHTEEENRDAEV